VTNKQEKDKQREGVRGKIGEGEGDTPLETSQKSRPPV